MANEKPRMYLFDNVKALLILLVVLGHMLEPILYGKLKFIYLLIYSFHMPLFVFCSGYFAVHDPKKILMKLVYPYIIFQIIYSPYDRPYLDRIHAKVQFTFPYWILWYIFAMIIWSMLLPFLKIAAKNKKHICIFVCSAFAIGVLSGYDSTLSYYLSIVRILYFLPFFVIGYYAKILWEPEVFQKKISTWYVKCFSLVLTALISWYFFSRYANIEITRFYGTDAYNNDGYKWSTRVLYFLFATIISLFVLSVIPNRKTFYSYIGQRTLAVYLLHGIIVRTIRNHELFNLLPNQYIRIAFSGVASILVVVVFSSGIVQKIASPFCSYPPFKRSTLSSLKKRIVILFSK